MERQDGCTILKLQRTKLVCCSLERQDGWMVMTSLKDSLMKTKSFYVELGLFVVQIAKGAIHTGDHVANQNIQSN